MIQSRSPIGLSTIVLVGLLEPAAAQPARTPPLNETKLHLSATGSFAASPDQLVTDLVAEITSPSAAAAQRRVNSMIEDGLRQAQAVPGVDARAFSASVAPDADRRAWWTAQRTLELRGDGPTLIELVRKLEGQDLAIASLYWQLSPALRRNVHDQATTAGLKELQARAASAAATLGLHVDYFQDMRLDDSGFQPRRPMTIAAGTHAMPTPQATASPEDVTATVSADVVLGR